ncbi:hypothetical protein QBC37DRAFT_434629 [Rhypophila decipiens]|uniref:Uncharacterized protein n=1 Tax=Rhypophila decipiens TaxID=261697 RepID=A0AAN6XW51_9PEZI|nr:hypothetical protein QBC37DRAFT_434629 [Rhypophila decipiens]
MDRGLSRMSSPALEKRQGKGKGKGNGGAGGGRNDGPGGGRGNGGGPGPGGNGKGKNDKGGGNGRGNNNDDWWRDLLTKMIPQPPKPTRTTAANPQPAKPTQQQPQPPAPAPPPAPNHPPAPNPAPAPTDRGPPGGGGGGDNNNNDSDGGGGRGAEIIADPKTTARGAQTTPAPSNAVVEPGGGGGGGSDKVSVVTITTVIWLGGGGGGKGTPVTVTTTVTIVGANTDTARLIEAPSSSSMHTTYTTASGGPQPTTIDKSPVTSSNAGLAPGAIAGIAIGLLLFLLLLLGLLLYRFRKTAVAQRMLVPFRRLSPGGSHYGPTTEKNNADIMRHSLVAGAAAGAGAGAAAMAGAGMMATGSGSGSGEKSGELTMSALPAAHPNQPLPSSSSSPPMQQTDGSHLAHDPLSVPVDAPAPVVAAASAERWKALALAGRARRLSNSGVDDLDNDYDSTAAPPPVSPVSTASARSRVLVPPVSPVLPPTDVQFLHPWRMSTDYYDLDVISEHRSEEEAASMVGSAVSIRDMTNSNRSRAMELPAAAAASSSASAWPAVQPQLPPRAVTSTPTTPTTPNTPPPIPPRDQRHSGISFQEAGETVVRINRPGSLRSRSSGGS